MDNRSFLKALGKRLYPILRSEGFRGSGNTLRRVDGEVVHLFNVQGSSGGTSCYLNLGAHLLFLPTAGGSVADAATLKEYECAFQDRFDSPPGEGTGWSYGDNDDEAHESIAFICDHWPIYGRSFFDRFAKYPESFRSHLDTIDPVATHPVDLLTFARIARHLGDSARRVALAEEGLRQCDEAASDLRSDLNAIIDSART